MKEMNATATTEVIKTNVQTALRDRAKESPVFNAMAHAFALRKRTRRQVTIQNLYWTMVNEGFNFKKDEYQKELDFLADLGVGSLDKTKDGSIVALKNINVTLQSLGFSALNRRQNLKTAMFKDLLPIQPSVSIKKSKVENHQEPVSEPYKATVSFEIKGRKVVLDLEPAVSPSEFFAILLQINSDQLKTGIKDL